MLQVFKTMNEEHFGELSFFRIYSGQITTGGDSFNANRNVTERIGQIYLLNGQTRETVSRLGAGDIGAVVKLKDTHTGNTLCAPKHPVKLPVPEYPRPNIHAALQPKAKGEEDKVAAGLATLHNEDPTFVFRVDPELHQTIISAQGELHLEVIAERLRRRFNVHVDLIRAARAVSRNDHSRAEHKYRHKKQTGGAGQFAEVGMQLAPAPRDTGVEFSESLSARTWTACSCRRSSAASRTPARKEFSPAIASWTWRRIFTTARCTRWTRRTSRSRSRATWRSRKRS